ncbi:uroporphyrinogen III methyltransferase/synthase [Paenibacillus phyllosphaerae]|uniref:Uroporphyrinogen-III C-methyltransferase n=1 Tax=Paenibacillus phyllosphaerae TaxID=274593 RepID=A0A7W5AXK9_9BACL|nr:uroporphyrinogen-III C-methyltransferase [Paenibacillus phyllosphaerae]MBB3110645.1 uroporphyrinogen III methyltransferase/synthase [Paenibacillus phyllosphaerae]
MFGKVYLTGAGPGDPKLITLRGLETIREADVLIYDRLVAQELIEEVKPGAELLYVGKASGHHTMKQEDINALIADRAMRGLTVTRLKGGDPFVFGRGGEEALHLTELGVEFEVIPGISSSIAAPAYAGIPVTHRTMAASFAVITGHECIQKDKASVNWEWAAGAETLVILMGLSRLPLIVERLLAFGKPEDTPIALIQNGTSERQRVVTGTIGTILECPDAAQLSSPVAIVVGEVVKLRDQLAWRKVEAVIG